jgi:4-amino-4-deoxy-L-arabinose transferase-like glycosyltransferase
MRPPLRLLALAAAAALLILPNLGNHYLWQDEAETALLARSILHTGLPWGFDGRNHISQTEGKEYSESGLWRWTPWLPYYVCAGSFAILGESTFTARIPFALLGLGCVLLTFTLARSLGMDRGIAALAAGLLALSVPFLLLARQCRYYSLASFLALAGLLGYSRLLEGRRGGRPLYFAAAVLLFHTQFLILGGLLLAVVLHWLVFSRREAAAFLSLTLGALLLNAPAIAFFAQAPGGVDFLDGGRILAYAQSYAAQIARFVFPPLLLAIPPLALVLRRGRGRAGATGDARPRAGISRSHLALLGLFAACELAVLSVASVGVFFRYLGPLIPILCIFAALLLELAFSLHPALALAALALWISTGPWKEYLYELTHDYDGPVEGIVKLLQERASPDDLVAITYEDLPLKFYTHLRVIGGLTGEDLAPALGARWIVLRKHVILHDARVKEYLLEEVDWAAYRPIQLDVPDTPYQNRESPQSHLYRTAREEDRVIVHERIR